MSRLIGAAQLEARLGRLSQVGPRVKKAWAPEAARRIRGSIPVRTGQTRGSVHPTADAVRGSHVVAILDAGARDHDEQPRRASVLRFSEGSNTIFARRVHHPGIKGKGFIAKDGKAALRQVGTAGIVQAWNGK